MVVPCRGFRPSRGRLGGSLADFSFHSSIAFVRCDSAVWNRLPLAVACVFFQIIYFPTRGLYLCLILWVYPLFPIPLRENLPPFCHVVPVISFEISCLMVILWWVPVSFFVHFVTLCVVSVWWYQWPKFFFFLQVGRGWYYYIVKLCCFFFSSSIFTFFLSFCYFKFRFKLISA